MKRMLLVVICLLLLTGCQKKHPEFSERGMFSGEIIGDSAEFKFCVKNPTEITFSLAAMIHGDCIKSLEQYSSESELEEIYPKKSSCYLMEVGVREDVLPVCDKGFTIILRDVTGAFMDSRRGILAGGGNESKVYANFANDSAIILNDFPDFEMNPVFFNISKENSFRWADNRTEVLNVITLNETDLKIELNLEKCQVVECDCYLKSGCLTQCYLCQIGGD